MTKCLAFAKIRSRPALICMLYVGLLIGCERNPAPQAGPVYSSEINASQVKTYRFAVHPLYNPQKLGHVYQPLIDYLNQQLPGVVFELEAARDHHTFEARFRAREPEFLLPNPWQTLQAMKVGYHVITIIGHHEDFKGLFVVRRDSPIKVPADVKGKSISYPSPTALAACIMPQYFLHTHGININRDVTNHYVGSHDSSIMSAYLKQDDIAATWPPTWRTFQKEHPAEAAELKIIWETPYLENNSVMVRDDVPPALREQVREILLNLENTVAGRRVLDAMETGHLHPANDAAYDIVRDYINRFEKEVRPVETP